jgi:tetratricopeptide (TPR) repeat protein
MFFDLGGDLTRIHEKIGQLQQENPGELHALAETVGKAIRHFPENLFLNYIAGTLALIQGRPLAGVIGLKKVLDLARRTDDHTAALQVIQQLELIFPVDLGIIERKAEAMIRQERSAEAAEVLARAGDHYATNREPGLAMHCYWTAYLAARDRRAVVHKLAETVLAIPAARQAIESANRFLAKDADCAPIYMARGLLRARLDEAVKADVDLVTAVGKAAESVDDLAYLQRTLLRQGFLEHARRRGARIAELDPDGSLRKEAAASQAAGAGRDAESAAAGPGAAGPAGGPGRATAAGTASGAEVTQLAVEVLEEAPAESRLAGVLRALVVTVARAAVVLVVLLAIGSLMLLPIYRSVRQSFDEEQLAGDVQLLRTLVTRMEVEKKGYVDNTFTGLVQARLLPEVPRDPWDQEYLYDWVGGRIVSTGENGVLETEIPGRSGEVRSGSPGDDLVYPVWEVPDWIVAPASGPGQNALRNFRIGEEGDGEVYQRFEGTVQGVDRSADKQMFLVVVEIGAARSLWTIDRKEAERKALGVSVSSPFDAVWAGTGKDRLVVQSGGGGTSPQRGKLHLVDVGTGKAAPIAADLEDCRDPAVDAKSSTLYFTARQGGGRPVHRVSLPDGKAKMLFSPQGEARALTVAPGGQFLALMVQAEGKTVLEVRDVNSQERQFVREDARAGTWPIWAPDGNRLAYVSSASPKGTLVVCHVRKKVAAQVRTAGPAPVRSVWMSVR